MSADKVATPLEPRITIDDLKHQAESVKSKAVAEAKGTVEKVVSTDATRTLMIVAGVVVVAASLAFFLGSRSGRAAAESLFVE